MFKRERLQKLSGCRLRGYVLQLVFTPTELAQITNVKSEDIHKLFRRTTIPNGDIGVEHAEWLLYDKLYMIYSIVSSLLRFVGYEKNADIRMREFLTETSMFRCMKEEPPWYPLPNVPSRTFPAWQPKNLREYLLEGRMVAVQNALLWFQKN